MKRAPWLPRCAVRGSTASARRVIASLAVLVLTASALAACDSGSSKNDSSEPTPTTVAPAGTVAPEPNCGDPRASFAPDGARPASGNMPDGTFMKKIQDRGRLIAGVSADTLLFGFQNPQTGQLEGFDIDIVRRVAQEIFGDPNKVEFRVMTYAQRIPALQDDSVDIVADVMTINCRRWAQISFSSQYYDAGQRLLVRSDSKATSINDLFGKKVCVANGSTNFDELKSKYPKVVRVAVDDVSDCMVLFQQGTVDAVTADDTVLAGFAKQDPYAKVLTQGKALTSEPYGLGIKKDHPEFVRFVNSVLEDVRRDGTWAQWYTKNRLAAPTPAPPPALYGRAS